jgi:hypothetical protein
LESGEIILGTRRGQIVAARAGEFQKFGRDLYANGMLAMIAGSRAAVAVPVKSREGLVAATFQYPAQNIRAHGVSFKGRRPEIKSKSDHCLNFFINPATARINIADAMPLQ